MTKSAFVAIVGKPNVGKSSLLNFLVGEKIAIISDKPQTTRTRITGVLTEGEVQLVFIDTPGLHKPKNKLGDYMVKQVSDSVGDVDCAVLVTDPFGEIVDSERQGERWKAFRFRRSNIWAAVTARTPGRWSIRDAKCRAHRRRRLKSLGGVTPGTRGRFTTAAK